MNKNDSLRLSLILDDNQVTTFEKTISKLIIDILWENFGTKLTVNQIIDNLRSAFSLDFSPNEVLSILKKYSDEFEVEKNETDSILNKFTLTISCYDRIKNKTNFNIDKIITRFVHILPSNADLNCERIENLIIKFLYSVFNDDAERLLQYMNSRKQLDIKDESEYTIDEKHIIDKFIEWDDSEKNQFLYKMLSSNIAGFIVLIIAGVITFCVLLGLNTPAVVDFAERTNKFGTIFSIVASAVLSIVLAVLKKVGVLLTDIDKIRQREIKKLEKMKNSK